MKIRFEDGRVKEPARVYLAGGMEFADKHGSGWRDKFTPFLKNLGYSVFNPITGQVEATSYTMDELKDLKKTDIETYRGVMQEIVREDLKQLSSCELVVCKLDSSVLKGAGTFGELTYCFNKGIPVYAWIDLPGGIRDLPGWAIGCITDYSESEAMFYRTMPSSHNFDLNKMEKFLEKVDK